MCDDNREDAGREHGDLELFEVDDRRLAPRVLTALAECELGICISRPYTDVEEMFRDFDRDLPDDAWDDAFEANPFRLGCTEGELACLSQGEFEQAFAREPIWCLHAMASHAENDPGIALVYEGCARLVAGQIIRAVQCSDGRLDASTLIPVARATLRYTTDLDPKVPKKRLETMVDSIRDASDLG